MAVRWFRDTYEITGGDAGGTFITRMLTPDGVIHDPYTSGKTTRREDWTVYQMMVYVLRTTSGCYKRGLMGHLALGLEGAGSWLPLSTQDPHGFLHPSQALVYAGPPFLATHGVGWAFYKGALASTDKVTMRILYEPVASQGRPA